MHLVGCLDAPDLRRGPGVPGLEIVDGGVGVDGGGAGDQLGDDLAQLGQLRGPEKVGNHYESVALIGVSLGIAESGGTVPVAIVIEQHAAHRHRMPSVR